MNLEEFQDLVDRFGERSADWPADLRDEAMRFAASSADAQAIIDEAASMRGLFAQPSAVRAPAGLADRIVALANEPQPPRNLGLRHARIRSRENGRGLDSGRVAPASPGPWIQPFKSLVWLGAVFLSGVAFGVGGALLGDSPSIDFVSLFAVLS